MRTKNCIAVKIYKRNKIITLHLNRQIHRINNTLLHKKMKNWNIIGTYNLKIPEPRGEDGHGSSIIVLIFVDQKVP